MKPSADALRIWRAERKRAIRAAKRLQDGLKALARYHPAHRASKPLQGDF